MKELRPMLVLKYLLEALSKDEAKLVKEEIVVENTELYNILMSERGKTVFIISAKRLSHGYNIVYTHNLELFRKLFK